MAAGVRVSSHRHRNPGIIQLSEIFPVGIHRILKISGVFTQPFPRRLPFHLFIGIVEYIHGGNPDLSVVTHALRLFHRQMGTVLNAVAARLDTHLYGRTISRMRGCPAAKAMCLPHRRIQFFLTELLSPVSLAVQQLDPVRAIPDAAPYRLSDFLCTVHFFHGPLHSPAMAAGDTQSLQAGQNAGSAQKAADRRFPQRCSNAVRTGHIPNGGHTRPQGFFHPSADPERTKHPVFLQPSFHFQSVIIADMGMQVNHSRHQGTSLQAGGFPCISAAERLCLSDRPDPSSLKNNGSFFDHRLPVPRYHSVRSQYHTHASSFARRHIT